MTSIDNRVDAETQLKKLDDRLGKGVGATRERAKLQAVIDGHTQVKKSNKKGKR